MKLTQEQAESMLLQLENIEVFLNNNSERIFGIKEKIKVLEVKRSKTLNPTSFNVLYSLDISGKIIKLRASTSTIYQNDYNYETLTFLRSHGFADGDITVAKPFTFFKEYNLLFYEDVPGQVFISELNDSIDSIKVKLEFAAKALMKLHVFNEVPFKLWDREWQFGQSQIKDHFPELSEKIDNMRDELISKINDQQKFLCHGDFQPNNLVFNQDHLYIIDWGSTTFAPKEIDLACFATQLANMLYKTDNQDKYKLLRDHFLSFCDQYNKETFDAYCLLYSFQMLDSTLEFTDFESNKHRIDYVRNLVEENLANIEIK